MLYLGAVYDGLRMAGVDAKKYYLNIKPKAGYTKGLYASPIFTTMGRVTNSQDDYESLDAIRYEIYEKHIEHFQEHRPFIFLQANDKEVAHTGDITSSIYKGMGSVGMVTDGNLRDTSVIDDLEYPVFALDTTPIDAIDYWSLTSYNEPIEIMGVKIDPMDWAFADKDGVMVIPKKYLKATYENMREIFAREDRVRDMIINGVDIRDIFDKNGRW